MNFQDKLLKCSDCGQEFTFTSGEQEFYSSRGLQNEPRRCPECRQAKKAERYGNNGNRAPRQMFPATVPSGKCFLPSTYADNAGLLFKVCMGQEYLACMSLE